MATRAVDEAFVGPFPDVVLAAPSDELTETEGIVDLSPNRDEPPKKRRRRRKPTLEHAALDLYGGHDGLLVRTALIRSKDYGERDLPVVRSPDSVADLCKHLIYSPHEHMVSIALNNANEVMAIHEAAIGPAGHVAFSAQQVLKVAFLTSATSVAVVHNHPSGDPAPSRDDIEATENIYRACQCVGLFLLDHVIVARRGWTSLAPERGWEHLRDSIARGTPMGRWR